MIDITVDEWKKRLKELDKFGLIGDDNAILVSQVIIDRKTCDIETTNLIRGANAFEMLIQVAGLLKLIVEESNISYDVAFSTIEKIAQGEELESKEVTGYE